jgi:uncharacterized protein
VRVRPAYQERALVLEGEAGNAVVIGDVHIGLEAALAKKGVTVPDQTPHLRARVDALLRDNAADRLVVVGDLKETIHRSSSSDIARLRAFLRGMAARVHLVPGNHDADLEWLGIEEVVLHPATGIKVEDVALTHGHVWPSPDIMDARTLVTSHSHPMVGLRDELGKLHKEPCWVRGAFTKAARERYPTLPKGAQFVILPAFNELLGGTAINVAPRPPKPAPGAKETPAKEGLGPLMRNGLLDLEKAKVYTLDGIEVGTVKSLRAQAARPSGDTS